MCFLRLCRLLTVNWECAASLANERPRCLMGIIDSLMENSAGTEGKTLSWRLKEHWAVSPTIARAACFPKPGFYGVHYHNRHFILFLHLYMQINKCPLMKRLCTEWTKGNDDDVWWWCQSLMMQACRSRVNKLDFLFLFNLSQVITKQI